MKNIKSATINGHSLEMKQYNGIYYVLHDDLCIANSLEFSYISEIFNKFLIEIGESK